MESKFLNIKVKTLDNSLHEIEISPESFISDLKLEIEKVTFLNQNLKVPMDKQRLIFQGKLLNNAERILNYKVF